MKNLSAILCILFGGILLPTEMKADDIKEDIEGIAVFSVYELSPQTTAIVSNMDENAGDPSVFDDVFLEIDSRELFSQAYFEAIYDNKIPDNMSYRDTTGILRLVYNKEVEAGIRPLLAKEFFVYGTKGFEGISVKEVVFSLDECRTNFFAFAIDKFDKEKYGQPVLATDTKIELTYGNDYRRVEEIINEYYAQSELDYKDNIAVKVYAHFGNFYFSYNDDFEWNKKDREGDPECLFPDRSVFFLHDDGSVELFWYDGLDLYGIPCD